MSAAEPTPAVAATVELDGVRLFTRRAGDGPPVVVLHGGPGAHHDYLLPQYDLLARGRTLLYYDQRGGGRSPVGRDTPVGWREHVADLEALRRHWSIDRLTLLGYSWGGLLAVLYWLEHPQRVERLALVSPAPARAAWRAEFERRFAARMADPKRARARADLARPGLRPTGTGRASRRPRTACGRSTGSCPARSGLGSSRSPWTRRSSERPARRREPATGVAGRAPGPCPEDRRAPGARLPRCQMRPQPHQ